MKRFLIVSSCLLLVIGGAFAAERPMLARVTVYWASGGSGADGWTRRHIAASGARLCNGHCAVDPRRIPYGSKVRMPDGTLVAVDTGSAVRNRRAARRCGRSPAERNAIVVDRFFETKSQALSWARRNPQFITVQVSAPNESIVTTTTTKTTTVVQSSPSRVNTVPPQQLRLRNSIATPRTESAPLVVTTRQHSPMPVANVIGASPKLAVADNTRSHFGRAIAYIR